jgi:hypothetical protein
VPVREIAEVISRHLNLPVRSLAEEFGGMLVPLLSTDMPASSTATGTATGAASRGDPIASKSATREFEAAHPDPPATARPPWPSCAADEPDWPLSSFIQGIKRRPQDWLRPDS